MIDLDCLFMITILSHKISFPFLYWNKVTVDHNLLITFIYITWYDNEKDLRLVDSIEKFPLLGITTLIRCMYVRTNRHFEIT